MVNKFLAPLPGTDLVLGGSVENLSELTSFWSMCKNQSNTVSRD